MKVIFFGSSEFSIAALKACLDFPHDISLVITTPEKKKGRGLKLAFSPVYEFAQKHGLEVERPSTLKNETLLEKVRKIEPDFFVASSYGKFIPSTWLKVPKKLCLNVHPSLLPKYRGAAPLNWPIIEGETKTGVSIAEITSKLDAGDVFHQVDFPLSDEMDSQKLSEELAALSYGALKQVLQDIQGNRLKRTPQEESKMTYARMIEKKDGVLDWSQDAVRLFNLIRGMLPWPVAYTTYEGQPLQILKAVPQKTGCASARPGELIAVDHKEGTCRIQAGSGALVLERVKPSGKKAMSAADFIRGRRLEPGYRFETKP